MAKNVHASSMDMALGMLAHMPWYHYLLMALVILALGVAVHLRVRRTYWPVHAFVGGADVAEHAAIVIGVELVAMVVVTGVVTGGMLAYHMA